MQHRAANGCEARRLEGGPSTSVTLPSEHTELAWRGGLPVPHPPHSGDCAAWGQTPHALPSFGSLRLAHGAYAPGV